MCAFNDHFEMCLSIDIMETAGWRIEGWVFRCCSSYSTQKRRAHVSHSAFTAFLIRIISDHFKDATQQSPGRSPVMSLCASVRLTVILDLCSEYSVIQPADQLWHRAHIKEKVTLTTKLSFTFLYFTAWSQTGVACSCSRFKELQ